MRDLDKTRCFTYNKKTVDLVSWCGEIGRRKGLKIPRWQHRTGSSPVTSTTRLSLDAHRVPGSVFYFVCPLAFVAGIFFRRKSKWEDHKRPSEIGVHAGLVDETLSDKPPLSGFARRTVWRIDRLSICEHKKGPAGVKRTGPFLLGLIEMKHRSNRQIRYHLSWFFRPPAIIHKSRNIRQNPADGDGPPDTR